MTSRRRSPARVAAGFLLRTTLVHVLTYLVIGALSYRLLARPLWEGAARLPGMRDLQSPAVQALILPGQVLRGLLLGLAFLPLRTFLLGSGRAGGLILASLLLLLGSLAGISGQIEIWLYTTGFHPKLFLAHLPETILQSLAFGYLLLAWERRGAAREA